MVEFVNTEELVVVLVSKESKTDFRNVAKVWR